MLQICRIIDNAPETYTANVYRGLQGFHRVFLQYLQGKPYDNYRISLQSVNITGFSLQILVKSIGWVYLIYINVCEDILGPLHLFKVLSCWLMNHVIAILWVCSSLTTVIFYLAWDISRDSSANRSKLPFVSALFFFLPMRFSWRNLWLF